jgi:hypothetical protein
VTRSASTSNPSSWRPLRPGKGREGKVAEQPEAASAALVGEPLAELDGQRCRKRDRRLLAVEIVGDLDPGAPGPRHHLARVVVAEGGDRGRVGFRRLQRGRFPDLRAVPRALHQDEGAGQQQIGSDHRKRAAQQQSDHRAISVARRQHRENRAGIGLGRSASALPRRRAGRL